jgi:outer membrane protein assembly factor BamD
MRSTLLLLFVALVAGSCSKFAKVQKNTDYEYKLRMAEKYYIDKKFNYAQLLYEELFPIYKGTDKFEDLYYKYAYCAYNQKDWMNAENLFKSFVEVFPTSPRAEEMEYMRAYTYYRQSPKQELDQTNSQKTIGLMQTFINTHPGSPRIKEATEIIDKLRTKMEEKDAKAAELYYNLGHFRAAAIAYTTLMNDFPDSPNGDEYKFRIIKSYYRFADNSIDEKKVARFEQVVTECNEFVDRFPESKYLKEVERFQSLSQSSLNKVSKK